jgi:hypothetical protein
MRNSSAIDLINIDLDNYADYMDECDKKLLEEIEAGTLARKGRKTHTTGQPNRERCCKCGQENHKRK